MPGEFKAAETFYTADENAHVTATLESTCQFLMKLNTHLVCGSPIQLLGIYLREMKPCGYTKTYSNFSFVYHFVCIYTMEPTLWDPMDYSPLARLLCPGKYTRIPEWVAISCSRGSSCPRSRTQVSCISCIGRRILYSLYHLGSPYNGTVLSNS